MSATRMKFQIPVLLLIVTGMILVFTAGAGAEVKVDPEQFERRGTIMMMDQNRIVIDDINFRYDGGTTFYSMDGKVIGSGYFTRDMPVGYEIKNGTDNVIWKIGKIKKVKE